MRIKMLTPEPRSVPTDNDLVVGDGIMVLREFEAIVRQDDDLSWSADRSSYLKLTIVWNQQRFSYEIVELSARTGTDDGDVITGTLLRAIPVQLVLKVCANRALYAIEGRDVVSFHSWTYLRPKFFEQLASDGPKPETLAWVARIYLLARIKLDPPTKYVAGVFEIPHRTASHWIKLARERGHLTIEDRAGGESEPRTVVRDLSDRPDDEFEREVGALFAEMASETDGPNDQEYIIGDAGTIEHLRIERVPRGERQETS